jgi:tetratricopeptide (TPR) repeat protein
MLMPEFFLLIVLLLVLIAVITLVGHGIWIALAALFRALKGGNEEFQKEGQTAPSSSHRLSSPAFSQGELQELDIVARQLRLFLTRGEIDRATGERMQQALDARRRMVKGPVPETASQRLDALLAQCTDVRHLSVENRRLALAWFRQLTEAEQDRLSVPTLLAVARLLRLAGLASRAVAVYRRLLEVHPEYTNRAAVAFEAGRFAAAEEMNEAARDFLSRAIALGLSGEDWNKAEKLLKELDRKITPEPLRGEEIVAHPALAPLHVEERETPAILAKAQIPEVSPMGPAQPAARVKPEVPVVPPPPRKPRRSLMDVLAGFMEERNILWGELVGGLLIVGCSIALVITLWKQLEEVPYFPFLVFASITLALFGAGQYTLHHWKLESTSRGLLIIALLLVPLNLLVLADPSRGEPGGWLEWGTKSLAIVVFTAAVVVAGRDLLGALPGATRTRWLLALAVIGAAGSQLVMPRLLSLDRPMLLLALACVPVAFQGGTTLALLGALNRDVRGEGKRLEARPTHALFIFLGAATFAVAVALGFLASRGGELAIVLPRIAVPVAVAGVPVLLAGLLVHRRLTGTSESEAPSGPETASFQFGGLRAAGTGVFLAGMALMLAALGLAWPQPLALVVVCAVDGAVLTFLAFRGRLPWVHAAALPCLVFGSVVVLHLLTGNLPAPVDADATVWLGQTLVSSSSGGVLVVFVLLLAAGAEGLVRAGQRGQAIAFAVGAGVAGLLGLDLLSWHGLEEPAAAAVGYGLCAGCVLTANFRWQRRALAYLGLGLLVAGSLWGLRWAEPANLPLWGLTLSLEAAFLALVAARPRREGEAAGWQQITVACFEVAIGAGILALGLAVVAPNFPKPAAHTYTALALAVTAFLLAGPSGRRTWTWIGSTFLLASFLHAQAWHFPELAVSRPLLVSLLAHATLTLAAARALNWWRPENPANLRSPIHLFAEPLQRSALVTSLLAAPLVLVPEGRAVVLAGYAGWLALVWFAVAWVRRSPGWFTAFQAALGGAVLYAVTAWLERVDWLGAEPFDFADPRCLQSYGIGLGLLALAWVAARIVLDRNEVLRTLWETPWPALDRLVLGGLVIGQLALAVWFSVPGLLDELTPARFTLDWHGAENAALAFGPAAWLLVGILALALAGAVWKHFRADAILGLFVLAITVPVLVAGRFAEELATASALRWGLAACFFACSVPVWLRGQLARSLPARGPVRDAVFPAAGVRWLLLGATVVPVLLLTLIVALLGFQGEKPAGPAETSFFARIGWVASNVTPLLFLAVGLVGHALRERSPGYAFGAGLVANVSLMGGYALAVVTGGGTLTEVEWVRVLQLGTLGAALWALAWLGSRNWVYAWREEPSSDFTPTADAPYLMRLQIALALTTAVVFLGVGVGRLCNLAADPGAWATESGSLLGWLALAAAGAAPALRQFQRRQPISWNVAALGVLAGIGMLACTVERDWPGWGHRTLMLGTAGAALLGSLAPFLFGLLRDPSSVLGELLLRPTAWDVTAPVGGFCLLAVLLALQAALVRETYAWSAAAVFLASVAGAVLAAQRRSEGFAFLAGLGGNLAATLLVCQVYQNAPFSEWWVPLAQANVLATAGAALIWMGLRVLLEGWPERGRLGGLLSLQCALGLAGITSLLLAPLITLYLQPDSILPVPLVEMGNVGGWLALLLAGAAAYWHLDRVAPAGRVHLLGLVGLEAGILLACVAGRWDSGIWLSFHVLTAAWCLLGLAFLGVTIAADVLRFSRSERLPTPDESHSTLLLPPSFFRLRTFWTEGIGLAILALALRCDRSDPLWPYGSAAAVLIVSLLFGTLGLWFQRGAHVYVSGLLLNVIGYLFWSAWGPETGTSFLLTHALCLTIASAFWSIAERIPFAFLPGRRVEVEGPFRLPHWTSIFPFPHCAALLGQGLLSFVIVWGLASDFVGAGGRIEIGLSWITLAAAGLALLASTWDRRAWYVPAGAYTLGLAALGLFLHGLALTTERLAWSVALALAGYVALTGLIRRTEVWWKKLGRLLHVPQRPGVWLSAWFLAAQTVAAGMVVALSFWICLTFSALADRLAGPEAVLLLVAAGVLLAATAGRWAEGLRIGTLVLGAIAVVEATWAWLGPYAPAPWLHRNVLLMASLALMTLLYGAGLRWLLPGQKAWAEAGRRLGPVLGGLATVTLLVLLGQEFALYDPATRHTPLAGLAVVTVLAALIVLMVAALCFAVAPGLDPLGLSERGRTLYVYAAEALLALAFVHVRLNVPELFGGWGVKYWAFIVMGIAFLGVGLSEFFERRKLPVLAIPLQRTGLFLPLLPLLAFWTGPLGARVISGPQAAAMGGADLHFGRYAALWFSVSVLYALVAATRRSIRLAVVAALAANFGLWALLAYGGISFLVHPQMWLIPLAVILLLAEQLNQDRLPREVALGLRYLGLSMVYVSSTADLFIAGIGNSVWLPVVLAVLSVLGVLLGIVLRVRAFLFLGVSFLFLDVSLMIWHAAVGLAQTWVWYASGIVLGAAILTLFAIFEKRRNDVLRLIESLKQWH